MDDYSVAVDVGGTFTDIVLCNLTTNEQQVHKTPSTPDDPSTGFLTGLREVLAANSVEASQVKHVFHGTTIATNAILENKGSPVGLVVSDGFKFVLEIGRQSRSELYNLNVDRPAPLAPWELRFGLPERVDHHGAIVEDLLPEAIQTLVHLLEEAGVDGIAVSFLFSFLNSAHEEAVLAALEKLPNNPFISISSKVLPEFREYERTSTVVINSYVGQVVSRYLTNLENSLGKGLRIMQSSGGSITARLAADQPVRTILSGPAGGVVGAFYTGVQAGYPDIITLDMGGTSTDVSLCPSRIKETTGSQVGGYPISVPMIDIHTVGAGGGSIARVDAGGALVVGPQSAGADPGPACYGKGDQITVTDANLVLGRMLPDNFLGGRMTLDRQRAEGLIAELASQISLSVQETALGVIRVVNANMARAIRATSQERGYDPRQFTMVPFGGAGPMHCCELAHEMGIPRVLVPARPGILSALGVAIADIVKDYSRTVMMRGDDINRVQLDEEFHGMEGLAREELEKEGLPMDRMVPQRFLDVRYVGQSFELTIDYPSPTRRIDTARMRRSIADSFYRAHLQRFGYADRGEAVEIVNLRLKLGLEMDKPQIVAVQAAGSGSTPALIGEVQVVFSGGPVTTRLYDRENLRTGDQISGPAIVLQMDTTVVITPGWTGTTDDYGNLVLETE